MMASHKMNQIQNSLIKLNNLTLTLTKHHKHTSVKSNQVNLNPNLNGLAKHLPPDSNNDISYELVPQCSRKSHNILVDELQLQVQVEPEDKDNAKTNMDGHGASNIQATTTTTTTTSTTTTVLADQQREHIQQTGQAQLDEQLTSPVPPIQTTQRLASNEGMADSVGGEELKLSSATTTSKAPVHVLGVAPLINGNKVIDKEKALADNDIDTMTSKVKSGQIHEAAGVDSSISDSSSRVDNVEQ
ncbi:unnamed protein product [Ambrosiozyma monospora]|uniref:Unnamed protein product n=1 Tax=Ambrosiozyma monospora TaxID=43982 RepID=A0A9W6Z5B5_AMBMO|nr:unnamed protein product [Ambrosiozyma monospora]